MNKAKLIALIEQELVQAEEATHEAAFEKHIYAIHTLTSLYAGGDHSDVVRPSQHKVTTSSSTPSTTQVTAEEIQMMGGKVQSTSNHVPSSERMTTDDAMGNGESIFDF